MNVIVVDDERIILEAESLAIKRFLPRANIASFQKAKEALEYAESKLIDIAFLDINIKSMTGLQLAKKLQELNPKINIIFCTGYSEYSLEALDLYCSAYLMKPITDKKLETALSKLRFPVSDKIEGFKVKCFGNFEAFADDKPISFKNKKTKELFAFLIDRRGATVSTEEIMIALYEDSGKESYIRNLRAELKNTLEDLGFKDVLVRSGRDIGVNAEKIDCDYYDYLDGHKELFQGEYMIQYSFAEETMGRLINSNDSNVTNVSPISPI